MSTNSCSDDTDLSCVFLPGGPGDLIPGTGSHTSHKTGCHGSLWSNLEYWRSDCTQTDSGASLFKMACLFCLSPLPFAWGFCLRLLYEAFVCCIWNALSLGLRGERGAFPFEHFFLWWVCACRTVLIWNRRGFIYTPVENICHFFHIGLSAPLESSKTIATIKTVYYCFLLLLLVLLCFIN